MRYWSTFFKCANYDVNFVSINQLLKKKKKNLCPESLKMPSHESWNIRCAKATVCQSWALRAGIINASQEDSASASVSEGSCSSTALKATLWRCQCWTITYTSIKQGPVQIVVGTGNGTFAWFVYYCSYQSVCMELCSQNVCGSLSNPLTPELKRAQT